MKGANLHPTVIACQNCCGLWTLCKTAPGIIGIGIKLPLPGFLWLLPENAGNEGIGEHVGASTANVYSGPSWDRGVEEGSQDTVSRLPNLCAGVSMNR